MSNFSAANSSAADAPTAANQETVTITIDGIDVVALSGEMLIAAAERVGTYIPRFCYHPRMSPVGMCRMCLVEVEGPRGMTLTPACFVAVAQGQNVVTDSPKVKKAQDGVLEFLLMNHPLDCPVCDKGGECPLQDQTLAYGPGESRMVEEKRHWEKPIPLSDVVLLDRERCIQCARCTRFADEIAGDALIVFTNRGPDIEVATFPDAPFSSYFSGNTVQICPVGALTAKPYRFKARPWDLEQVESTCTSCSVGCRIAVQSSSGQLTRYLGLDADGVNQSWLCDKGRFDFEAVNQVDERITVPMVRKAGELVEVSWGEALDLVVAKVGEARKLHGAGSIAVIGGARLANEDAYAWAKLAKAVIGTDSVDAQLGDGLPAEAVLGLPRATIDDACSAGAVILLAPDLKEELPVLHLRLRAACQDTNLPIIELGPTATGLSRHAAVRLAYRPGEVAAVARALVAAGDPPKESTVGGVAGEVVVAARAVLATAAAAGKPVVVVLGRPSLAERGDLVAEAAGALFEGIPGVRFLPALRRANVMGALDMGLAPGVLPGRVSLEDGRAWFGAADRWGLVPVEDGQNTTGILSSAAAGKVQTLFLLGADPVSDFPDRQLANRGLDGAGFVVAVDTFPTASTAKADVILPAAAFGERAGTTTNIEGRVSRLGRKITPPGVAWPDWMIAAELAYRLGGDLGIETLDQITDEIARVAPSHFGLTSTLLGDRRFADGIVVPIPGGGPPEAPVLGVVHATDAGTAGVFGSDREALPVRVEIGTKTADDVTDASRVEAPDVDEHVDEDGPSAPSGRWAVEVGVDMSEAAEPLTAPAPIVFEPFASDALPLDAYALRLVTIRTLWDMGTLVQHSPSLAHLGPEGLALRANPGDLQRLALAPDTRVRVHSPRSTITATVTADPSVPRGSAVVAWNARGGDPQACELIDATAPVTDIRLETPLR